MLLLSIRSQITERFRSTQLQLKNNKRMSLIPGQQQIASNAGNDSIIARLLMIQEFFQSSYAAFRLDCTPQSMSTPSTVVKAHHLLEKRLGNFS
jgi:hypothetical protein